MQFFSFIFLGLTVFFIFKGFLVSLHDKNVRKLTVLKDTINKDTDHKEYPKELDVIGKVVKELQECNFFNEGMKGSKELAEITTIIRAKKEESYSYSKSILHDEPPSGINVITIGKLEYNLNDQITKFGKLEKDTAYFYFIIAILTFCLIFNFR